MKPFIEKLPLQEGESFAARIHTTPAFEVPWHQHEEAELIYIIEGEGICRAGNYMGAFRKGELFYIGGRLPHQFENNTAGNIISAAVIHFREDLWGEVFLSLPENRLLGEFFSKGKTGLKVETETAAHLKQNLLHLAGSGSGNRMQRLLDCLFELSRHHTHALLSGEIQSDRYNFRDQERINTIYRFTMAAFREKLSVSEVAAHVGMTVPAFCSYFRKRTHRTYIDFLNEVRIGYAGKLLVETDCSVSDACHSSGFNNLAHFNRQFLKIKGITPSRYRNRYDGNRAYESETDLSIRILERT